MRFFARDTLMRLFTWDDLWSWLFRLITLAGPFRKHNWRFALLATGSFPQYRSARLSLLVKSLAMVDLFVTHATPDFGNSAPIAIRIVPTRRQCHSIGSLH